MDRFELRFYPPVVCAAIAVSMVVLLLAFAGMEWPNARQVVLSITVFALSIAIAGSAVLAFRKVRTTVHPLKVEKASSLVTDGIFGWSRNPMYLGMALSLVAVSILLGSYWALLGPTAFVVFITRFQILPEERAMRKLFGATFEAYCKRVRRWI